MNLSQEHSGTRVRYVNRACFPKENTPELTQKWAKFMSLSFWPFLWFAGATPDTSSGKQDSRIWDFRPVGLRKQIQSRFLGRGCDEALFSVKKKGFSVKRGGAIQ